MSDLERVAVTAWSKNSRRGGREASAASDMDSAKRAPLRWRGRSTMGLQDMVRWLLPREDRFYELIERQGVLLDEAATAGVDQSWRQYEPGLPPPTGVLRVRVDGGLSVTGMAVQSVLLMSAKVTVSAEAVGRVHRVAAAMHAAATPERLKGRRNMGLS